MLQKSGHDHAQFGHRRCKQEQKISDKTLKRIDVMLSNNEIDFYIIWAIKIEERIERIGTKDGVTKKNKNALQCFERKTEDNQGKC